MLKKLEAKKGYITPQEVVEEARAVTSPIHTLFDWDNESAGEKYRLWQARMLIADVKVELMGKETDAYYSATIAVNNVPVRGYFSAEKVASDSEIYLSVIKTAVQELSYWKKKYKEIKELRDVVDLDKAKSAIQTLQQ